MTVAELIAELSRLDGSLPVFVRGYEGGVDDVLEVVPANVYLNVNSKWYYGAHEVAEDYHRHERTEPPVPAVVLWEGRPEAEGADHD